MFFDTNSEDESLSLSRLPGGNIIQEYYDGTVDKRLNFEIQAKVKPESRQKTVDALTLLTDDLIELKDLKSEDGSFDFNKISVGNELYFSEGSTDGYIYFRLDFQPTLTIYK
ncbi:capsid protein [Marinilactibacillus sp. Marseille-P9653]|uniref:capsid protein n=1 Tax=Marinilactibacillus sp. Marseille-P9653 TaxID=2866583 RepID=UPI001CE41D20|nr:capsid protein [Marinilactibacillus sp. Marseille-P9653]